ncbi:TetR/AcrR family transcriptional regulator [Brenneria tiliae]|uniref:TetR/AcrR family transcriptional regulator n=1 Tax=Brenneria tiliae TaxID=2914984 RepID=UPI002014D9EB|nr:TetR/AcrR family transcriptional regulator [Brenneria tiliae]MCL2898493.1 TetR/AcrR family transcriptional regulator [Brenneria tiliae]MCL2902965.1 TetR/AcrR family transcriptional regulator [Brenneria tiliae]
MAIRSNVPGPRERILATASQLFFQYGCRAVGINKIIAQSNVAKASFYEHFPSKELLILAWLNERESLWLTELRRRLMDADTPQRRVSALFSMWRSQINTEGFRGCGFNNTAGEFADERSPIRERVREHKNRLRVLISEEALGVYRPLLSQEHFNALANGIYCLFDSAIIQAQSLMDEWPLRAAELTAQYLVNQYLAGG